MRGRRERGGVVHIAVLAAVAVIGALLPACGDDDTTEAASNSSTTTTASAPAGDAPVPDGNGCTPGPGPLPDGRWYGLVESASDGELSFDLACWFSSPHAEIAAAEDGGESSNDYWVRNEDPAPRTVPVAEGTSVVWYPSGSPTDHPTVAYDQWRTEREARDHQLAVWLDVEGGSVRSIEEQWVP